MSNISVNGKTYSGRNIEVRNNNIIIDGKLVECDDKVININVEGDVNSIETASAKVTVAGNVKVSVETVSGDVKISGDVGGYVKTVSGDVNCKSIAGSITTVSGDIN